MLALVVTATALSPPASGAQASDPTSFRSARWVGFDITANRLNQYTVRTNASAIDVLGAAKATATVAVNGVGAYEKGEYFWRAVPVSNSSAPVYPTMSVVATEGANSTTNSGKVYLGPVQENFSYDLDGNLTADSRWDYTWDLENRLKRMETRSAAITAGVPRTRLDFAYDAEGRRTQKSVLTNWNGSVYQATNVTRFLYDPGIQTGGGWNLLAEVDGANNVRRSYAWGLDLMGNLETEGNIGGLLMVVDHTGGSAVCHFAAYDGNGNLTALVKTDQTVAARYEYGPFGEPIRLTGALAKANPFRWSTKFTDEESGLVDYGCRFYSPSLGRWISRDPIEEGDTRNLYALLSHHADRSGHHPVGHPALSLGSLRPALSATLADGTGLPRSEDHPADGPTQLQNPRQPGPGNPALSAGSQSDPTRHARSRPPSSSAVGSPELCRNPGRLSLLRRGPPANPLRTKTPRTARPTVPNGRLRSGAPSPRASRTASRQTPPQTLSAPDVPPAPLR
jgi:RHS repeat-associated protein